MRDPIDWEALARGLGAVREGSESGSGQLAREALCAVLGPEELRRAVDWYVAGDVGSELVRSVLWLLHPWEAMARCHEIWASGGDIQDRRRAVALLRVVADRAALPWIPGLLDDEDAAIRGLAIQVVDQLVFAGLVEAADVAQVLVIGEVHPDEHVREWVGAIREQLARRP